MWRTIRCALFCGILLGCEPIQLAAQETNTTPSKALLRTDNLVAWCIVPFDAKKRSPAERSEMLKRLGLKKVAYDWRAEHVEQFETEIQAYQTHGIDFFAFWDEHDAMFRLFEQYDLHPQVWKMLPQPSGELLSKLAAANDQATRKQTHLEIVEATAKAILPLVQRTREMQCALGLYNHGGWAGEPANMAAVCQWLHQNANAQHVGIVYNFHHGHAHIQDFQQHWAVMQPYILCVNINGMNRNEQPKILPVGQGEFEQAMFDIIRRSGYVGPIGILDHQETVDAEESLRQNLEGIKKLAPHSETE